jgi:hypothetical protein
MLKCKGNLSAYILLAVFVLGKKILFLKYLLVFISESEWSQVAYVTFKNSQGADTAVLLSVCSTVQVPGSHLFTYLCSRKKSFT